MKQRIYIVLLVVLATFTAKAQDTAAFKPSGKFSGQVFGDYEVKTHADSLLGARGSKAEYAKAPFSQNFNSFELRRIYLGYDYNFTEKFTAQLLLSHEGNNYDMQGNRTFLLKLANIRWKNIYTGGDLVVGQMSTNAFALLSEQVWGYRSIEKTILDMRGITKSSDFGIALQGKYKDGTLGYNVMLANNASSPLGGSYGPENNPYKKVYADVFAKFMDKKIIVDLYGDYEKSSNDSVNFPHHQTKVTMKAFIAYQTEPFTIGVEVFQQTAENFALATLKSDTTNKTGDTTKAVPFGWSIFARAPIIKGKLGAFARYDSYDPDTKYSSDFAYSSSRGGINGRVKETFLTAGLDWTPTSNVHFMPNIWMNTYSDRAITDAKGKAVTGKAKSDYDLVARLTFFWKF